MLKTAHLKLRKFSFCVCYVACVATLYSIGVFLDLFVTPATNVINWDAGWYNEIRQLGYVENHPMGKYASCAFYPLFPLVWKWSGLDPIGILFLNGVLFILAVSCLFQHFRTTIWQSLLFLSTPMLLFCFLPYTEALSFFLLSFFLIYFQKRNLPFALTFLFLAGWTRPLVWQIVPLVATWLILDFDRLKKGKFVVPLLLLGTTLSSFLTMNLYQYYETGIWNANVRAYSYWGGHLQKPLLPLRTFETALSGIWVRQIDYLAFVMCMLGLLCLVRFLYKVYFQKRQLGNFQLLFAMSCAYLASMMLIRLLTMKGDFWSLGRYIFVNPFFAYFLFFSLRSQISKVWGLASAAFLLVSQMLFAKHDYFSSWTSFWWSDIQFLTISSNMLYLGQGKKYVYAFLILLGMLIQCYLLHCFLIGKEWVG